MRFVNKDFLIGFEPFTVKSAARLFYWNPSGKGDKKYIVGRSGPDLELVDAYSGMYSFRDIKVGKLGNTWGDFFARWDPNLLATINTVFPSFVPSTVQDRGRVFIGNRYKETEVNLSISGKARSGTLPIDIRWTGREWKVITDSIILGTTLPETMIRARNYINSR